jgi:hypothetical protein
MDHGIRAADVLGSFSSPTIYQLIFSEKKGIICEVGRSLAMWGSVNLGMWGRGVHPE